MTDSTKKIHFTVYDRGAISRLACLLLLNDFIQFMTKAQPPDSPEIIETWNFDFKFHLFPDCKAKKRFVLFWGESTSRRSAYGFIWTLARRNLEPL